MPVHLTTHTNTGAFQRLNALGVPYDRIGSHAYMDSVEAINSGRNYGLAIASYATKANKPPLITEWNWRFLTRMKPDARAQVYPPIFENVLKTRCMPVVYQFQFQDGLAMSPTTLKGIRHYEQLNLSRRPKPEAMEMMKLIQRYSDPTAGHRVLVTNYQHVELREAGQAIVRIDIANRSNNPLTVKATAEGPSDMLMEVTGDAEFEIPPGQTVTRSVDVELVRREKGLPGFYHGFVRLDAGGGVVSYAWFEARWAGAPAIDAQTRPGVACSGEALAYDFNRPLAVVYPEGCTVMELEAAWVIYQTLEAATGRVVDIFQSNDLPAGVKNVIWVGRGEAETPAVTREGDRLVVSGKTEREVTTAAMDLTLRYWKTAKDSGASRVGLVAETGAKGGVKTDLD